MEETTQDVIQFKQRILREAPYSATRDITKGREKDKIFYMKEPGVDAVLSGTGATIFRYGWGATPVVRRYGGLLSADKQLRKEGYRPYNIFSGMEYEQYEQKHKYARQEKERRETIFIPRVNKAKEIRNEFPEISQNQIPDITSYGQAIMPQQMQRTKVGANRLGYNDIIASINSNTADISQITRFYRGQTMTPNEFSDFAYKGYTRAKRAGTMFGGKASGIKPKNTKKGGLSNVKNAQFKKNSQYPMVG